jgi:hypothetical protein
MTTTSEKGSKKYTNVKRKGKNTCAYHLFGFRIQKRLGDVTCDGETVRRF